MKELGTASVGQFGNDVTPCLMDGGRGERRRRLCVPRQVHHGPLSYSGEMPDGLLVESPNCDHPAFDS